MKKSLADCETDRAQAVADMMRAITLHDPEGYRAAEEAHRVAIRQIEAHLAGEEP